MPDHFCQWDSSTNDGSYFVDIESDKCCGKLAHFTWNGDWFCAEHYDFLCKNFGDGYEEAFVV